MKQPKRNAGAGPPAALLKSAHEAARHAYAPYSGFVVGAAVETADGQVFTSANMENASYGLTVCAEVGALQAAYSAGMLAKVRRIVVVGGPEKPVNAHRRSAIPPCGRCRQLIAEAAHLAGYDIEVWYGDLQGTVLEKRTIAQLLPDAFGRQCLNSPD